MALPSPSLPPNAGPPPMPAMAQPGTPEPAPAPSPFAAPPRPVGPFGRMNQQLQTMGDTAAKQGEALHAVMQMLADQQKTMHAFMTLVAHVGEMIQRATAQSQAESARLMAALSAEKEIAFQLDDKGKAVGATVRPAQPR